MVFGNHLGPTEHDPFSALPPTWLFASVYSSSGAPGCLQISTPPVSLAHRNDFKSAIAIKTRSSHRKFVKA